MPVEYCDSQDSADHTPHSHALFTSRLALFYAFTSTGHKQAAINEEPESNIHAIAGAPRVMSCDRSVSRRRLPVSGLWREVQPEASGREKKK